MFTPWHLAPGHVRCIHSITACIWRRAALHFRELAMDGDSFDKVARYVNSAANRRSLIAVMAGAGLLGVVLREPDQALTKRRKRKKKKSKRPCTPDARATTCQGRCGVVANNCGTAVQCGDSCPVCSRCSDQGTCVRDAPGTTCAEGKTCTADGRCECDSSKCESGKVCVDGTCEFCGAIDLPCCANNFCQALAICLQGRCERCGRSDEVCCLNDTCDAGRACQNNVCRDI